MLKNTLIRLAAIFAIASAFLFSSCSTDVDLLDDYKPITVVYGLLNVKADTQYIKVNKAFLGEGNALDMAKQSDSINYKPGEITVQLQQINPSNGQVIQTINCSETTQIPKDDGTFSNPYQILYLTGVPIMENSNYKLLVRRNDDEALITASTSIVNNITVTSPTPTASIAFYNPASQTYLTFNLRWNQAEDAFVYSAALRFTYYETLLVSPFTTKTITLTLNLPDVLAGNTLIGQSKQISIKGEDFFGFLESSIKENPDVQRVANDSLEFFLSAGTQDLETYIEVNKPSLGLIQEKPVFTNIDNGTGIFTSRWSNTLKNKMTPGTLSRVNQLPGF